MTILKNYPKEALFFIIASFINSMGSALMWPLTTLYVHNVLHRSYGDAGFVLLLQSLAGIIGQIVGGSMFHKLGVKKLIVGSLILTSIAQVSIIFISSWTIYMATLTFLGFLMSITMPAINAFIGFHWKEKTRELFNVVYVSNNVGMAIGSTLSGILATISFHLIFLFNGLTTFGFALFFLFLLNKVTLKDTQIYSLGQQSQQVMQTPKELLFDYKMYLFIGLGSLFVWFSTSQWSSGIAPYLDEQGFSMARYSFLWTINGIVIFAGQPITSFLNRTIIKSLSSRLVASALFYAIAFVFMVFFHHYYLDFIIGMIIATIGEMLIAPTIPAFITERTGLAAPFYLGVVGGFGSFGRLLGPYIFGNMYDYYGVIPILTLAAITSSIAVLLFLIHASYHKEGLEQLTS
ncbi:major Facilitator Superfamily protein [Tepidibacillus sp. HK-1]|nr:major Facilitator Superfamily protein [Tepidibacillus sp. HK-1]